MTNTSISDTCPTTVRRPTGYAATPFTRTTAMVRCERPTAWLLVDDETGTKYGWSCRRHRSSLEAIMPADGFSIVAVA